MWYNRLWSVRATGIGEPIEHTVMLWTFGGWFEFSCQKCWISSSHRESRSVCCYTVWTKKCWDLQNVPELMLTWSLRPSSQGPQRSARHCTEAILPCCKEMIVVMYSVTQGTLRYTHIISSPTLSRTKMKEFKVSYCPICWNSLYLFWRRGFVERAEGRGSIFSVGYLQIVPKSCWFLQIACPFFNIIPIKSSKPTKDRIPSLIALHMLRAS